MGTTSQGDVRHSGAGCEDLDPRVARSREKILAAASELIIEGGTKAATVDAVSARAGVSKATLYRQWSSQTELLVDTFRAFASVDHEPVDHLDYRSAVRALLAASVERLSCPHWRKMLPAMIALPLAVPEAAELLEADHCSKVDRIEAVLALGRDEGEPSAQVDPETATMMLFGPLIFATLVDNDQDLSALAESIADRFLGP